MRYLIPALLILAGCGTTAAVRTEKGPGYEVDCGGPFSTKLDCNKKANETCPTGFDPISSPPGHLVFTCSRRPAPMTSPL